MKDATHKTGSDSRTNVRLLGQWTQRYVHSRSVPVLVGLAVFGVIMGAMLVLWSAAGEAYRSSDTPLLIVCGIGLFVTHVLLVWLSVPRWGGERLQRWAWRYYDREGQATPREPMPRDRMRIVGGIVACIFGACILAHVVLGLVGLVSAEAMFPISALYIVPFLTFLFVAMRVHIMLLYPFLYGAHAAIAGAGMHDPITALVPTEFRSMVAMVVYGVIAVSVSHVYNRIALSRMARYGRLESE